MRDFPEVPPMFRTPAIFELQAIKIAHDYTMYANCEPKNTGQHSGGQEWHGTQTQDRF